MASVDTVFTRLLLKQMHADIKRQFPEIENVIQACGVTRTTRANWTAEIVTPHRERFYWNGRAFNAHDARYKGWAAFRRKYGPPSTQEQKTVE
jgi:hypothetical protein